MNIEICCCSGGMAEGLRRAGIVIDLAIDKDPDACDSYERNLGHRPVQMDARDLLRMTEAGWRPGPIDLLVADPPCTPWSRAGKRQGVKDERDLLHCVTELIALLRPSAYLIGNVPGLQDSTQWHHVQAALAPLRRAGYCIADFAELDAADYGVPQHRIRPFWVGHLAGPCVRWLAPTHCSPEEARQARIDGPALKPWVTCRDALQHLPLEELGRPVMIRRTPGEKHPPSEAQHLARTILTAGGCEGRRESVLLLNERHPPASPASPAPTLGAKSRQQGAQLLDVRVETSGHPWPWDRPATTVETGPTLAPFGRNGRNGEHQRAHPNAIVLSERAAALLQGFPDGWVFSGATKKSRWGQLGQAMPPALAEAVGRSIAEQMRSTRATEEPAEECA